MDFKKLLAEERFKLPDAVWPSCASQAEPGPCEQVIEQYLNCVTKEATMEMLIGRLLHAYIASRVEDGCYPEVPVFGVFNGAFVRGRIDLMCVGESGVTVYEIKSASRKPERPYREHLRQLAVYVAAVERLYSVAPVEGYVVYINKHGPPEPVMYRLEPAEVPQLLAEVAEVAKCLAGLFPPRFPVRQVYP
jgi:CRISPR/Cas system-associated exonuclease Cas4 (RecB family)